MTTLCFASRNAHKRDEIAAQLGDRFRLLTLDEVGLAYDNSLFKARYVWERTGLACFADDSGLEVAALDGAPGVHSAYYAGPQRSATDNIALLLRHLASQPDRRARFKTVITLFWEGQPHQFSGTVEGDILPAPVGTNGFGYDPVFRPLGLDQSFGQLDQAHKNQISHRARAVQQLVAFLAQKS